MADETTDSSNKEQATVILCYATDGLEIHEDFIGLYNIKSTNASTLTQAIKCVFEEIELA